MKQLNTAIEYYQNLTFAQGSLLIGILIIGLIWIYMLYLLKKEDTRIVTADPYEKFEVEEQLKKHLNKPKPKTHDTTRRDNTQYPDYKIEIPPVTPIG